MSKFKAKAEEVVEQGTAERGTFEPTGTPLRIYKWWAERTKKAPERENFCHFWRVVAIWAPLMWLRKKGDALLDSSIFWGLLLLTTIGGLITAMVLSKDVLQTVGIIVGTFAACIYAAVGAACGVGAATDEAGRRDADLPRGKFLKWGFIATAPVAGFTFVLAKAIMLIGPFIAANAKGFFAGILALAVVTGWVFAGVAWDVPGFFGAIFLTAAIWVGGSWAGNAFSDWAERMEIEERKRRKEQEAAEWAYFEENGQWPPKPKRAPGKTSKFFSGVKDFLIFIGQVIRVNKWKICPIVEVK